MQKKETIDLGLVEHTQDKMELLEQQVFVHQHMEYVAGNPDRGCFSCLMLKNSIVQNLDMVPRMMFEVFAPVVAKVFSLQCYNPNYNNLDSVGMYNLVVIVTSHKMVN